MVYYYLMIIIYIVEQDTIIMVNSEVISIMVLKVNFVNNMMVKNINVNLQGIVSMDIKVQIFVNSMETYIVDLIVVFMDVLKRKEVVITMATYNSMVKIIYKDTEVMVPSIKDIIVIIKEIIISANILFPVLEIIVGIIKIFNIIVMVMEEIYKVVVELIVIIEVKLIIEIMEILYKDMIIFIIMVIYDKDEEVSSKVDVEMDIVIIVDILNKVVKMDDLDIVKEVIINGKVNFIQIIKVVSMGIVKMINVNLKVVKNEDVGMIYEDMVKGSITMILVILINTDKVRTYEVIIGIIDDSTTIFIIEVKEILYKVVVEEKVVNNSIVIFINVILKIGIVDMVVIIGYFRILVIHNVMVEVSYKDQEMNIIVVKHTIIVQNSFMAVIKVVIVIIINVIKKDMVILYMVYYILVYIILENVLIELIDSIYKVLIGSEIKDLIFGIKGMDKENLFIYKPNKTVLVITIEV